MTLARWAARAATLMLATALAGCGYNDFQRLDEQVKAGPDYQDPSATPVRSVAV